MMEFVDKLYAKTVATVADKTKISKITLEDKLKYNPAAFIIEYQNHMTKKQIQFFKGQVVYDALHGRPRKFKDSDTYLDYMTINQVFANVWSRENLSMDVRSIINVALLAAFGRDHELESHIKGAINQGVNKAKILEIMIHVAHYAGWPAGHNGQRIVDSVFKEIELYTGRPASGQRVVICDFDGTITSEETFEGLLYRVLPKEDVIETLWKIHNDKITLREGVTYLIESIDSNKMENIKNYAREKNDKIRFGFKKFLKYLEGQKAKLIVVSGGLKILVENLIKCIFDPDCDGHIPNWPHIHAIEIDPGEKEGKLKIINSSIGDNEEAVSKIKIIDQTIYSDLIYIGDSKTDEKAAWHLIKREQAYQTKDSNESQKTHVIFARDSLAEKLEEGTFVHWNDFVDIQNCLKKRWNNLNL